MQSNNSAVSIRQFQGPISENDGNYPSKLAALSFALPHCEPLLTSLERKDLNKIDPTSIWTKIAGDLVIELISLQFNVSKPQLMHKNRCKSDICIARQAAMYLLHTSFSVNYTYVAEYFSRDRTTVSHACRVIEDIRDDEIFDEKLQTLENILKLVNSLPSKAELDFANAV